MKKFILFFGIIFICLLQAAVLDSFSIFRIKPDFMLILVILFSLKLTQRQAILFSLFAGILKDSLMYPAFGINTLFFPLWSYLIINLCKKISVDNNILYLSLMFIVSGLHNSAVNLTMVFSGISVPWYIVLKIIVLESLYSSLALFLVLKFFRTRFMPLR